MGHVVMGGTLSFLCPVESIQNTSAPTVNSRNTLSVSEKIPFITYIQMIYIAYFRLGLFLSAVYAGSTYPGFAEPLLRA